MSLQFDLRVKFFAVAAAMLLCVAPAHGADHLWPENSYISNASLLSGHAEADDRLVQDYWSVIAVVFKDMFAPNVELMAFRENPLVAESAVGIRKDTNGPRIFAIESSALLFRYAEIASAKRGDLDKTGKRVVDERLVADFQEDVPHDPKDVKLARCEIPIDTALAARIERLWEFMVRGTRYDTEKENSKESAATGSTLTIKTDGTTYHFSDGAMFGQVYSWDAGPNATLLMTITDSMASYCEGKSTVQTLTSRVGELERLLQSK